MKRSMQGLLLAALVASAPSVACTEKGKGFVPDNNLRISVWEGRRSGITEDQFNAVIDKYEALYSPIVAEHGANLVIERKWTDPTVNAYAQQIGKTWKVSMFGGLARHETITEDGFALVVCHELGHHLGGAPKKVWGSAWASNEGQSDYFATLKCLRRAWENEDNRRIVSRMEVPEALKKACSRERFRGTDYHMCVRGGMAGMSVAKLFQSLRGSSVEPKFETPDTSVVTRTNDNHPATQCRLDTYFQGALCEVDHHTDVSNDSEVTGTCHASERHRVGLRPACWFKPSVR